MRQSAAPGTGRRVFGGRPSIRAIGAIAGGAALIATAVLISVTIVGSQERARVHQAVERDQNMTQYYQDARTAAILQGAAGLSYFTLGDERYLVDLRTAKDSLDAAIRGLTQEAERADPVVAGSVEQVKAEQLQVADGLNAFLARLDQGDKAGAIQLIAGMDIEGKFRNLSQHLRDGADASRARLLASEEEDSATEARWSNIAIGVGAIWAITTLISIAVLLQWVARPLARVARAAHALEAGDLTVRVTADGLRETYELATAFNAMAMRVEEATEQLRIAATTDSLTGLPNYRSLMETLDREIERSIRYGHPLTVLMMDIDAFKHFNDAYGHLTGDDVLRQVAEVLRSNTRNVDVIGRYGGDEFMGILPETDRAVAIAAAKRVLEAFAEARVRIDDSHEVEVSLSLGIAVCPDDSKDVRELLAHADIALYEAKTETGNSLRVARRSAA